MAIIMRVMCAGSVFNSAMSQSRRNKNYVAGSISVSGSTSMSSQTQSFPCPQDRSKKKKPAAVSSKRQQHVQMQTQRAA